MAEEAMRTPSWLTQQITFGNLLSIGTALFCAGGIYVGIGAKLEKLEASDDTQKKKIEKLETDIAGIPQLGYRVTLTEGQLRSMGDRVENGFSNFSARLDRASEATASGLSSINSSIAALDTRVAVLTQSVEIYRQERRAENHLPPPLIVPGARR